MNSSSLNIVVINDTLSLHFEGEFDLYSIAKHEKIINTLELFEIKNISINLSKLQKIDTASSLFLHMLQKNIQAKNIQNSLICEKKEILDMLEMVANQKIATEELPHVKKINPIEAIGHSVYENYLGFVSFLSFLGKMFYTFLHTFKSLKDLRFKEIAFEINESAVKALWIVSLTSFLMGLVVAYQSAYQLKLYGANIFIVDMLGISMLRELSPLITAIVIAGRSGSAFTAQIGAMKITQELDAMRTMGFDPYMFLVLPRITALMIAMPILIFVSDITAMLGGMLVANIDLQITPEIFIDRFRDAVALKHFFIGAAKGPFFAFLIATIGIYRGLMVKDDTQSIGFNTTKSVVEAIFAVIICDAVFSIAFTNLGI